MDTGPKPLLGGSGGKIFFNQNQKDDYLVKL